MEYEKIKQLMNDMSGSKLSEINVEFPDGLKISMKKQEFLDTKTAESTKTEKVEMPCENASGNIAKSPMVGTVYLRPSPDAKPYVEVGKKVKKGEKLCIIEAMKLMNEIETEFSGVIKEVLVEDGSTVEYGTKLFVIE